MLQPGDRAPSFTLLDQREEKWRLVDQRDHGVALFFFPKANTGGCTAQATGLRDVASLVGNVQIVGISPDSPRAQASWDDKHQFGFPLLSDPNHKVASKYGAWGTKKLYGREYQGILRSLFLLSPSGRIENVWMKISPKATPTQLLMALGKSYE
ncbi:MAG TPA: peroxiredoxin [Acidimicrobiales bacterium]|nr:peroxiredoxin [Acidimicrobiales bacterium]